MVIIMVINKDDYDEMINEIIRMVRIRIVMIE